MIDYGCILIIACMLNHKVTGYESSSSVDNFQLVDLNSSLLVDGFPVYFYCKFNTQNRSYSILFRRIVQSYPLLASQAELKSYKSVRVYLNGHLAEDTTAKSILFLSPRSFLILKEYKDDFKMLTRWIYAHTSNLTPCYLIDLTLRERNGHQLTRLVFNHTAYASYQTRVLNGNADRSKRLAVTKKYNLTVEACVFIHRPVYEMVKSYLRTNDVMYVRLFFLIKFTEIMLNVDKIFQTISEDEFFRIEVRFKRLFLDTIYDDDRFQKFNEKPANQKSTTEIISIVNKYVQEFFKRTNQTDANTECDHVFFMHDYPLGTVIGLAYLTSICAPSTFTSMSLYLSQAESVLAHELGHNLGADHDTLMKGCKHDLNLMYPASHRVASSFVLSECSNREFRKKLFDEQGILHDRFSCLIESTHNYMPHADVYEHIVLNADYLPGYAFSHSDQCKLLTNDQNAYSCRSYNLQAQCRSLHCVEKTKKTCIHVDDPLDGTACGPNRVCLFFECVQLNKSRPIEHKIWSIDGQRFGSNELEKSANTLKNTCPSGASHESSALEQPSGELAELTRLGTCENALMDRNQPRRYNPRCSEYDQFNDVCCEKCLAFKLNNCSYEQLQNNACRLLSCADFYKLNGKNPCFNDGVCVDDQRTYVKSQYIGFRCVCKKGFKGPLCLSFDPCELDPCSEHEICIRFGETGHYYCLCPPEHADYPFCRSELKLIADRYTFVDKASFQSRSLLVIFLLLIATTLIVIIFLLLKFKSNLLND